MHPEITTIGLDADDTLWHNETIFDLTQKRFAELLAGYAPGDHIDARLLEAEKRNIHHYGFGIKGFTLSMIETAIEVTEGRVPGSVIDEILKSGREMLAHPVELLPDVDRVVERLAGRFHLVVITKGDLFDQERKIAQSGIDHLIDAVEVVNDKTPETYHKLFNRHGRGADHAVMIGNSMKSDIIPALEAGAFAIYIPYRLTFALERAESPDGSERFFECPSILEAETLVQSWAANSDLTG